MTPGAGAPTTTFDGSVCSGPYTDPILGGTDVYAVGAVLSGPQIFGDPYQVYVVHEGGPLGADVSWVVPAGLTDLASAQALCASFPAITPAFVVDGAKNVLFKV